ncbi:hypothetical protein AN189_17830 [Loktanella sp. 3ANDIMAR09]|uniref:hypothetical protein n=1 Tax=Loktanella sp. 3ANDIMAR09 TaxID=1225657 RepID=UPI0006FC5B21|nr:hypothetical protein [Loktanella sp. 3ANDIMAR09]KQI66989.1 hypothetical protein AN189_17830 [Loktanella sp. 3ANDIMAR09]
MTQLPGIAGEIEDAIGLELTAKLLKRRGGTEINIPVKPTPSLLSEIIGTPATLKLIETFGPGRIALPCGHMRGRDAERLERRRRAIAMLEDGASVLDVALRCDLNQRTVKKYRAELDQDQNLGQEQFKF